MTTGDHDFDELLQWAEKEAKEQNRRDETLIQAERLVAAIRQQTDLDDDVPT